MRSEEICGEAESMMSDQFQEKRLSAIYFHDMQGAEWIALQR
jgi:hypothetical protein